MEQYIIKGGNPLVGEVVIGGAKNAALPVLAAAVMTDGKCMIDNMPDVRDINVLLQAMQEIGADIDRTGKHEVTISGKGIHPECDVDNEFIRKIRMGNDKGIHSGLLPKGNTGVVGGDADEFLGEQPLVTQTGQGLGGT